MIFKNVFRKNVSMRSTSRLTGRILPALFLSVVFPVLHAQPSLPDKGLCAHRGAMARFPENTLPAFREAVRLGVAMIEMDVRRTKDGHLVILHDKTVDRTTDGHGLLRDLTFSEVRRLDAGSWKGPAFAGTRIPTLDEALQVIPENIWINLHVKEGPEVSIATARKVMAMHKHKQSFLACSREDAEAVRRLYPEFKICNMERQADTKDYVELTLQMKSDFIQFFKTPVNDTLRHYTEKLKAHGIRINYFFGENAAQVKKLWDLGVDFVFVNDPAAILEEL